MNALTLKINDIKQKHINLLPAKLKHKSLSVINFPPKSFQINNELILKGQHSLIKNLQLTIVTPAQRTPFVSVKPKASQIKDTKSANVSPVPDMELPPMTPIKLKDIANRLINPSNDAKILIQTEDHTKLRSVSELSESGEISCGLGVSGEFNLELGSFDFTIIPQE